MHIIEITIQRQTENRWPVVIEHNTLNNLPVRRHGDLQLDEDRLFTQFRPRDYGHVLGEALFHGAIRDTFTSALHAAGDDYLRVLLHIEAEQLKSLRWERLCAPFAGGWDMLLLNQHTIFAHYLPSLTDLRFRPFGRRDLRALVLVASPSGLDDYGMHQFDAVATATQVQEALGDIPCDLLVNDMPEAVGPATLKALARQLTAQRYTLIHFVAHGQFSRINGETALFLADEQNRVARINSEEMLAQLRSLQPPHGFPHFAFLGTCDSAAPEAENVMGGLAQRLVRDLGMPAVLAMTEQVSIHTLKVLTKAFYARLREHGEADRALVEAMTTIDTPHHDIIVPAIYTRLEGRPLFSDNLERMLTESEVLHGLDRMKTLIDERAPILQDEFKRKEAELQLAPTESQQLYPISQLCQDTLEVSFPALALGLDVPAYDGRCPFQGLAAFGTDDRTFFFGREDLVEALVERLQAHPFLAVRGPSGSGKSSLILAGVIPALQVTRPELLYLSMTPGTTPLQGLENLLAANSNPDLLFVDQFEELFTLCTDVEEREAFVQRLLTLSSLDHPPMIVLALRDDFWADCQAYGNLYAKMEDHYQQIMPMAANVLRGAVEQQASAVGLRFEADLSNTILDDVAGEPGAMPLLQHGLKELWEHRHGRWLRASEYRKIGGIQQAIARTAERIYNSCTQLERALMENVMLRLVRLDGDTTAEQLPRDTRRRASRSELTPLDQDELATRPLVARLANESLVITKQDPATNQDTVEIAHEALIGYWDRLQKWLQADRETLLQRQDINNATRYWLEKGRDRSLLYRGKVLKEARELASQKPALLNENEHRFLREGQRHERQRLASGILLPIVAMAVVALVSFNNYVLGVFTPLNMDSAFNVAILDFGEIQPDGQFTESSTGNKASTWLYNSLTNSTGTMTNEIGVFHRTSPEAIGKGHLFKPLLISDPDKQCERASELADDIGSQMIIFGTIDAQRDPAELSLDTQPDQAEFELLFYVTDDVQQWIELNNIETGSSTSESRCLPLGDAFSVSLPLTNSVTLDALKKNASGRGPIFFGLILAMIQDSQGDWSNALDYLSQVESYLEELELGPIEAGEFGADLVAMLIGQQYLRQFNEQTDNSSNAELEKLDLPLLDKAVENFQNALSYEGRHQHRAEKAMGDIWLLMVGLAQDIYARNGYIDGKILDVPRIYTNASEIIERLVKHPQNMTQGLGHISSYYQSASKHAKDLDDPHVALAIDLSLAQALWQEGQQFYIIDKQDEAFDKLNTSIDIITKGEDSLLSRAIAQQSHRLIAQAYGLTGVAYFQLADILRSKQQFDEQLASLKNAEKYFDLCISKADDAILDKLIIDEIVNNFCKPYFKEVQLALEDAQINTRR